MDIVLLHISRRHVDQSYVARNSTSHVLRNILRHTMNSSFKIRENMYHSIQLPSRSPTLNLSQDEALKCHKIGSRENMYARIKGRESLCLTLQQPVPHSLLNHASILYGSGTFRCRLVAPDIIEASD